MTQDRESIRRMLDQQISDELIIRLTTYALGRVRGYLWHGHWGEAPTAGKLAKDFVMDAIVKVYTFKVSWNTDKDPDLLVFLKDVIKTDVSNLAKSWENRKFERMETKTNLIEGESIKFVDQVKSGFPKPSEALLSKEQQAEDDKFLSDFIDYLGNDQDLSKVIECIMDGLVTRREIAVKLGVNVNEVTNRKKKLKRRLTAFRAEYALKKVETSEGR